MPLAKSFKGIKGKAAADFLQAPKGMHDILPADQSYWDRIRRVVRDIAEFYNFGRIDTPCLEQASLFERGVGVETDMVGKEMYVLRTKGGDILALRPEGTAPVLRAYLEHGLARLGQPQKLFYEGPMFRHESTQAGRFRQFHQIGFEIIGAFSDPLYDAQVIVAFQRLMEELKIKEAGIQINSIGCKVCRPLYKRQLQAYYRPQEKDLCANCQRRLKTNPLRVLDCKNDKCQPFKEHAPNVLDKLCAICCQHLRGVLEYLDELKISYTMNSQLVRGLDYYNRTVFEFVVENAAGAEIGSVAGGGRYDYLAELLGGKPVPATGASAGVERLIGIMKMQQVKLPIRTVRRVFVAHAGELARKKALHLVEFLHKEGIFAIEALARESLRAQLKVADKEHASLALIVGQKEVYEECVIMRDMRTGLQETLPLSKIGEEVKKRLRSE